MFQVHELFFVESQGAWAVALTPDTPGTKLEQGAVLIAGARRWTVTEIHAAPMGLLGARLDGDAMITRGLVLRPESDPISDIEFNASVKLMVRLLKAARAIDADGIFERLQKMVDAGGAGDHERRIAKAAAAIKSAVLAVTDEELKAASLAIGIGNEL